MVRLAPDGVTSLPDRVREAAAGVAERATLVRIDEDRLDDLAATLSPRAPELLAEERPAGDEATVCAVVVAWNAVNFGSGWFPRLHKRPGMSGARTLAAAWNEWYARTGPPTTRWLEAVDAATVARVFEQPMGGELDGLLDAFARAWHELGRLLAERFDGSAAAMVEAADGSAARLAETFAALPSAADVHEHDGHEVPLYKRAQIVSSHLAGALDGRGLGRFGDLDQLTAFADNLVPHVLRHHGALVVDESLAARIDREDLLASGERGEVEMRAVAVHAVELLAERVGATASAVDHQLWQAGQDPAVKARPRHRCRSTYY